MSSNERAIGLAKIAENAQVAVSTVSRALRNSPEIHPKTRKRILREAQALGYETGGRTRGKNPAHPTQILVLTAGEEPPRGYMTGLSQASIEQNVTLNFHSCPATDAANLFQPDKIPVALKQGIAAGAILIYRWPTEIAEQIAGNFPRFHRTYLPKHPGGYRGHPGVGRHLHACRASPRTRSQTNRFFRPLPGAELVRARYAPYIDALIGANLPLIPEATFRIVLRKDNGTLFPLDFSDKIDAIVKQVRSGVSAWIVPDEGVAYALETALIDQGIRIPEDVSVVGFHRHPSHPANAPLVTSVSVNVEEMTKLAIKRILSRQEDPDQEHLTLLVRCKLAPVTPPAPAGSAVQVFPLISAKPIAAAASSKFRRFSGKDTCSQNP